MSLRTILASMMLVACVAAVLPAQDLTLTSAGYEGAIVGQPFSYTIASNPTAGVSFSAVGLPTWLTCNAASGIISGTPLAAGCVLLTVSASDASGVVSKSLRIDINASTAVVISPPGTLVAEAGNLFNYQMVAIGQPTAYSAVGLPSGLSISTSNGFISGIPTVGGTYPVSLIALNAQGSWVTSLNMNVYPNEPVVNVRTITTTVGSNVHLDISGSNLPTSYDASDLPSGLTLNPSTGIITGVPTTVGTSNCTIAAINAGGMGFATWTIVVSPAGIGNVNGTNPFPVATVGSPFSAQVTANGTPTGFTAVGLPANLAIDPTTGSISGTPTAGSGGTYPIIFSAIYAGGTVSNSLTMTVTPLLPVITIQPTIFLGVNTPFSDGVQVTNSPTSFTASGLPPGLIIDAVRGVISGAATSTGTYSVSVSATNGGGTTTAPVTFSILSLPAAVATSGVPIITNAETLTALVGIPFSASVIGTNSPTSYAATNLPAGMAINATTGIISGTATTPGVYAVSVSCANGDGSAFGIVDIFVYAVPIPAIDSSLANQSATLGSPFSYQVYATYSPTAFSASGLPPGLTINSTTGLISGTPSSVGTYSTTLSATDATGTINDLLIITVTATPTLPNFSFAANLVATVGSACSFTPHNNGGTTYSASGLPGTLSINAGTGAITGTPAVTATYPIMVSGTNASGTTVVDTTIIVNPLGGPGISSALTTISGAVGTPLAYTITSSTTGATFSAAGLPPGTTVDPNAGIISGSPTAGGTFVVIIMAEAGGLTTSEPLTITVTPAAPVITNQGLTSARVGDLYYSTIDATNAPTGYTATGLPTGLVVDPVFGTISGITVTAGPFTVTVTASNAGGTGSATYTLSVNPPGVPTITSPTTVYVLPNVPFSYQVSALNDPTGFSATGLPTSVILTASTGVISGTITSLGTVQAVITVTNAAGSRSSVLDIVTVTAGSPGAPQPPVQSVEGNSGHRCGGGIAFGFTLMMLFMVCMRFCLGGRPK